MTDVQIARWEAFAAVFNDTTSYPTLADAAAALGQSLSDVGRRGALLQRLRDRGFKVPFLICRNSADERRGGEAEEVPSPRDHARARADSLGDEVRALLTLSRYPVVNPEAVIVEGSVTRRYHRAGSAYVERESTPRTWLADTLRVEAIPDCRGLKFIFTCAQNDLRSIKASGLTSSATRARSGPRSSWAR